MSEERTRWRLVVACSTSLMALQAGAVCGQTTADAEPEPESGNIIRLLPPRERQVSGRVLIETLVIDPQVQRVELSVDGEVVARRKVPPWEARVSLDSPPRQQRVGVVALGADDRLLGSDEMVVNRVVRPLRVTIRSLEESAGGIHLVADVSVPEEAELETALVQLNGRQVASFTASELVDGRLETDIDVRAARRDDLMRVVALLADGRSIEDVAPLSAPGFTEEIDVHLVQLQVVVTTREGRPISGLEKQHFEIREKGRVRQPAGLFVAEDVSLLLGLSLDSSGSMARGWERTRDAAAAFIERTLGGRDQGFLVDFDTRLRLLQPRTGDKAALLSALDELEPEGGTALYDSVLYSLLQFERQQGRRGLVVLTDGYDVDSRADPERAVEFGRKLGVPIYILAMEMGGGPRVGSGGAQGGLNPGSDALVHTLHLLTDPTGGRLFRVGSSEQMLRAFAQINAEMRNQYVLTYYTETPPEPGRPPDVRLLVGKGKGFVVKTVLGADHIY
jgi:Ca-activated chloride channel family protein